VEILEDRTLLSGGAPPLLTSTRGWILYSPSSQVAPSSTDPTPAFNPQANAYPTDAQITADLQKLVGEGWKGIVTYSLLNTLADVPRIANGLGLHVIAGLYYLRSPLNVGNEADLAAQEVANAVAAQNYVDGYVVGNEGLLRARSGGPAQYQLADVAATITALKAQTGNKPMTTTEPSEFYLNGGGFSDPAGLRNTGDWEFPNDNWYNAVLRPADARVQAQNNYFGIVDQSPGRTVVIKESFWPSAGAYQDGTPLTQQDQASYFMDMATLTVRPGSTVYFTWGEAFDQYWKVDTFNQGPNWGFHLSGANYPTAKLVISQLQSIYTANYAPPAAPVNLGYGRSAAVFAQGVAITSDHPASSGGAVFSYAIAPALPTGLFLAETTGDIFGTPTVDSPPTQYTVTATNSAGSTTAVLTLGVEERAQLFVNLLYRDLLGRNGALSELNGWANLLAAGVSRTTVALGIESSPEYRQDVVSQIYLRYLGRPADATAFATWVSLLNGGGTIEQVEAGVVGSPEYLAGHGDGSNQGFVNAVYQDALGRSTAGDTGAATWVTLLNNGTITRQQVAAGVFGSGEFHNDILAAPPPTPGAFAGVGSASPSGSLPLFGDYRVLLNRFTANNEQSGWVDLLNHGVRDEIVIALIASSPEFDALTQKQ
jgi:exo-beta-1,3-glucanase (GH17 family)